jgi:outer membrane protein insertion porin family
MPIYFITFAEAGNVWDNLTRTDPFDLKRSAGVGMRIMLQPIGLIGFDYGYGFDPVRAVGQKSGWQFHVQFGR